MIFFFAEKANLSHDSKEDSDGKIKGYQERGQKEAKQIAKRKEEGKAG
jgi:hypothetical protein